MKNFSPIKARILQYIEFAGITKQFFCEKTGISYANIKGKSLESEIGGSQIAEILSAFGEISADWLITGKGEMLRSEKNRQSINQSIIGDNNSSIVGNAIVKGNNNAIVGGNNNSQIFNKRAMASSPSMPPPDIAAFVDLLKNKDEQIEKKDEQIERKDEQIEKKDEQIERKDEQIKELLEIIKNMSSK